MSRRSHLHDPAAPDARLLTRGQVAKRFGVSIVTIDRWTKKGILHPVDAFELRRVLFKASEIDELAESLS